MNGGTSYERPATNGVARGCRLAVAMLACLCGLLLWSAHASALSFGLGWSPTAGEAFGVPTPEEAAIVRHSGATVYRIPLDFTSSWENDDRLFRRAWENGVTILPLLNDANTGGRFLRSTDADWAKWSEWAQAAVERYGVNGTFWAGKANPTPVTAWESWNEPNLPEHNPIRTQKECQAEGSLPYYAALQTCVQSNIYGSFLQHTAIAIQTGATNKTGHGTELLFGGLYMPNPDWSSFLSGASAVSTSYTAVAIHPYAITSGVAGMAAEIEAARTTLDGLSGGSVKPLWVTEVGWPVYPGASVPTEEAEQATLLRESFNWVKANSAAKNIQFLAWYNLRDTGGEPGKWDNWCGVQRENGSFRPSWTELQAETGAYPWPEEFAAFHAPTETMWEWSWVTGGGTDTHSAMAPGTSPGVVSMPDGSHLMAFQANTNVLWTYSTKAGWQNLGLGMAPGSSPSIAVKPDGTYMIAFESNLGQLWTYSSVSGAENHSLGVYSTSSPSIAAMADGSFTVAFQSWGEVLWTYNTVTGAENHTLGMRPGSSPSVTALTNEFAVAFQTNLGQLGTYSPTFGYHNWELGVAETSSPSITQTPNGNWVAAFQDWAGHLWTMGTKEGAVNHELGVTGSPSISYLPQMGYLIGFRAWDENLWTFSSYAGAAKRNLGLTAGTNPSVSAG